MSQRILILCLYVCRIFCYQGRLWNITKKKKKKLSLINFWMTGYYSRKRSIFASIQIKEQNMKKKASVWIILSSYTHRLVRLCLSELMPLIYVRVMRLWSLRVEGIIYLFFFFLSLYLFPSSCSFFLFFVLFSLDHIKYLYIEKKTDNDEFAYFEARYLKVNHRRLSVLLARSDSSLTKKQLYTHVWYCYCCSSFFFFLIAWKKKNKRNQSIIKNHISTLNDHALWLSATIFIKKEIRR